ncbi:MAG: amino acid permease [Candidatus Hydrogenedentota bacterium]|nr:MAG: amino acid permease [Candidatus Hydrogenedentota bacterium]
MNKKFWTAVSTLSGTVIGAGFLGIPYVVSKSGFYIGLAWMILLSVILMMINLVFGQIVLSSKNVHQIAGYASKYLGRRSKKPVFLAVLVGFYAAFVAYLIGEGESFSFLFFGNADFRLLFGIAFFVLASFLTYGGIKRFKKIEPFVVISVLFVVIALGIIHINNISVSNYSYLSLNEFYVPFGVILFAFLGFAAIPEMKRIFGNKEKDKRDMKKAIIIGSFIPLFVYVLFTLVVLGLYGKDVAEVATISFGPIVTVLGMFAMFSAYLAMNLELQDSFKFDLYFHKKKAWFWTNFIPFILFLVVVIFDLAGFSRVLGIGGAVSGGLVAIVLLAIHERISKDEKLSKLNPEFKIRVPLFIKIILALLFIAGILFEFF